MKAVVEKWSRKREAGSGEVESGEISGRVQWRKWSWRRGVEE